MSQQAEGVLTTLDVLDDLVRSNVVVSKDQYSCDGTDLFAFPNNDDNPTTGLNDEINTEAAPSSTFDALESFTFRKKNNDGSVGTAIQAPTSSNTNPLSTFGLRIQEVGNFVYDAPTVLSSDWAVGQQPKMVDRIFTSDPAVLRVDNNESKQTIFDFGTNVSRDIAIKFSADIISGTPNLSFEVARSTDNISYTVISSSTLTDGVPVTVADTNILQFIRITITGEEEAAFSANFNIFECLELVSPTVTSSDWTPSTNIVDGNLNTSETLLASITSLSSETVADFGSIASRNVFVVLGAVNNISAPNNTFTVEVSDDNITYSPATSGTAATQTISFVQATSLRYVRITVISEGSSFDVDQRIYLIGETVPFDNIAGGGSYSNTNNAIDNDFNTFASATNNLVATMVGLRGGAVTGSIGCTIQSASGGTWLLRMADDSSGIQFYSESFTQFVKSNIISTSTTVDDVRFAAQGDDTSDDSNIFQVFFFAAPIITSSDWSSTSLMIDNKKETFDTNNVVISPTTTVADFSSIATRNLNIRIEGKPVTGTPTTNYTVEISDDNAIYSQIDSGTLVDDTITDISLGANSFKFARVTMGIGGVAGDSANLLIYEIYSPISPIITSSDWSSTSNMIDSDLDTFNTENASNLVTTRDTIIDFASVESRDVHALIRATTTTGSPSLSFVLSTSVDNVVFNTLDSGALVSGITKDASGIVNMRYAKVEITGTEVGNFEADFDIFEVYDSDVVNGLDSSIIKVGGSTSLDSTVNQTDPLTFTVSDSDVLFHPPRYFDVEQNKFLTGEVTALRTGQVIDLDRGMTWIKNYAP